jgi:hypothetical protein
MPTAIPIFANVPGAPFKIGQRVRVLRLVDDTGESSFLGKSGTVEYLEYSCGCGQLFPEDPMVGVRFPDGILEEFWRDELNTHRRSFKQIRT